MRDAESGSRGARGEKAGDDRGAAGTFRSELARLGELTDAISIVDFEPAEGSGIERLIPYVRSVLDEASDLFLSLLDHHHGTEPDRGDELPAIEVRPLARSIDAAFDRYDGVARIVAIALLGHHGAFERTLELHAIASKDGWDAIDSLGGALREVAKVAAAADVAIARHTDASVEGFRFVREIDRALDTRRAYVKLRAEVTDGGEASRESVISRLRGASEALSRLVARPIYPHLRTPDRREVRRTQARVSSYLHSLGAGAIGGAVSEAQREEGLRLHRELGERIDEWMQVNRRLELRAHDARLSRQLLDDFESFDVERLLVRLEPMLGRCEDLDRAILRRCTPRLAELRALLEGVFDETRGAGG